MAKPNLHYAELKSSYLFYHIEQRTNAYRQAHPGAPLLRLGVGDVTLPLCPADGSLSAYFEFLFKLIDIWTPYRP